MRMRDAKRIWRHRRATIQDQIRNLENSPERSSPRGGIIQRILDGYRRERDRYDQLIHATDHSSDGCAG
jgi:hypothetical protein